MENMHLRNSSLYAEYYKEREGITTVETENWFFNYKVEIPHLIVLDAFITKSKRNGKAIYNLVENIRQVAKDNSCAYLYGFTEMDTENWEYSDKLMKKLGFKKIETVDETNHYVVGV